MEYGFGKPETESASIDVDSEPSVRWDGLVRVMSSGGASKVMLGRLCEAARVLFAWSSSDGGELRYV